MSETVTIPRSDLEALHARIEDLEDRLTLIQREGEEAVPMEVAERLWSGENPIRAWRGHRGLSQRALAEKAGLSGPYLNEVESGKKPGSVKALKALSEALNVSMDDLA